MVVNQELEVFEHLNNEIVGKSQLCDGTIYLAMRDLRENSLAVLKFEKSGVASIIRNFKDFDKTLY